MTIGSHQTPIGKSHVHLTQGGMTLKAFAVLEGDENTGGIVFADRAVTARRMGADLFADGDFAGVSCKRAPWADAYAENPLPIALMIEHGWRFECVGCGATISEDWLYDEDLPIYGVIGTQFSHVYCCEICEARDRLHRAIKRDHERRAIEALKAHVKRRLPGVTLGDKDNREPHAYATEKDGVWIVEQAVVSFEFPGMNIGPATCRIDRDMKNMVGPLRPQFFCCAGDRDVFEAWAASPESRHAVAA